MIFIFYNTYNNKIDYMDMLNIKELYKLTQLALRLVQSKVCRSPCSCNPQKSDPNVRTILRSSSMWHKQSRVSTCRTSNAYKIR